MATRKNFYYILMLTDIGPKFVTELSEKKARWFADGTPLAMTKEVAKDIQDGLLWNGHFACLVRLPFELGVQPFDYEHGHFEWVKEDCYHE